MFEQLRTRMWTPAGSLGRDVRAFGRDPRALGRGFDVSAGGDVHLDHEGVNVDLAKRDGEYVLVADLPGFEREDVHLSFDDGVLALDAESETHDERESDGDTGEIAIRGAISSSRRVTERVTIPEDVVADAIDATFRNGVLEVHLPLVESEESDDETKIDIGE